MKIWITVRNEKGWRTWRTYRHAGHAARGFSAETVKPCPTFAEAQADREARETIDDQQMTMEMEA